MFTCSLFELSLVFAYSDCCCCCSNCIYHIMFYRLALFLALGFGFWKWINSTSCSLDPNHDCNIGSEKTFGNISHFLAYSRKLGNRRSSEGLQSFKPSKGTNLLTLIILAGDIEMIPGPRFLCRLCKKIL